MKRHFTVILGFWISSVIHAQTPTPEKAPDLSVLDQALEVSVPAKPVRQTPLPYTPDTQIRMMGLFEQDASNDILNPADTKDKPYMIVENVPLRGMIHLLARRSGINYLEPDDADALDAQINLEMREPKPRQLLDWLLKHRNLELYDAGTGLFTVRRYTNQLSFFKFKLKDNFIDRFKGSASGSGGAGGGGGMMGGGYGGGMGGGYGGGMMGGGNAVSAHAGAIQVENEGKYGEIEALLEKVAGTAESDKKTKAFYYPEKQTILLFATKDGADRVSQYLEIANQKNPNIRIDVRIFATGNNPSSKLGVDWSSLLSPGLTFGLGPQGQTTTGNNGTNSFAGNSLKQLGSLFGNPMSSVILQNNIQATLNFFVNDSKAEAITQPSAITANDREVAFAATQQIPYVAGSSVAGGIGGYGSGGVGYDSTAFVSVGTTINLLPRIQSGNRIKLGTSLSISQLDKLITISSGTAGSSPRQVPQTSGRAFSGEFTINSGETVVIAGLKQSTVSKSNNKVPYLGDIPGLGKLFRNESNDKANNYLTIFITATVLDEGNQPGIPEQKLQSTDKYPDDESSLTAEANSSILLRKTEWTDKALVHAKKEALDMRTEQANQIIASRIRQEERVRASALDLDSKEVEIKELTFQQKQLLKHGKLVGEGSIEKIKQDVDTKLVTAKAQRDQMAHSLKENQASLAKLQVGEQGAKQAVQQAEDEYARVLRDDFQPPATKSPKPEVKPVSASPTNPLDENAALLQRLERSKQN